MPAVYIALGSNIGDRQANLREAVRLLSQSGIAAMQSSSIYETEPVDYLEQPWFLNAVVGGQTDFPPLELLRVLRRIESQMGSQKVFAKGPRRIDLDILLYGDATIDAPELQVPHPRMLHRNFVLVPLAEIAPAVRHASWPATVHDLLANSPDRSVVRKLGKF